MKTIFTRAAWTSVLSAALLVTQACLGDGSGIITPGTATGLVRGTLYQNGEAVPGARLRFTNINSGSSFVVTTGAAGGYLVELPTVNQADQPAGAYRVAPDDLPLHPCHQVQVEPDDQFDRIADVVCRTVDGDHGGTSEFRDEDCGLGVLPDQQVEFAVVTQVVDDVIEAAVNIPGAPPLTGVLDPLTNMLNVTTGDHDVGGGTLQSQALSLEVVTAIDPSNAVALIYELVGLDQTSLMNAGAGVACLVRFDLVAGPSGG